jgi:hypothetical protein
MHQKQPPAKVAFLTSGLLEAAWIPVVLVLKSIAKSRIKPAGIINILFIVEPPRLRRLYSFIQNNKH